MGYKPPISETEHSRTFVHNKAEIAPDEAWIVSAKSDQDTATFLTEASPAQLRDVFNAVADLEDDGQGKCIFFHAVRAGDDVQNTNSKLPELHIHTFTGDFAPEFEHISDKNVKSYVVQPNPDLEKVIKAKAKGEDDFQVISLNKDNGGEMASHQILVCREFTSFDDFAKRCTDDALETFREKLLELLLPTVEAGAGGARIVIDDRHTKTGMLAIQVLSGENMDRSGQNKQRYFQKPSSGPGH